MGHMTLSTFHTQLINPTHCSEGERIWAGVDGVYGAMSLLEPVPTARGSLCYYKSREGEDKWREAETFK